MFDDKLAAILSSLSPPVTGARMPRGTAVPPHASPVTPGLGEKMRAETSRALEQALTQGHTDALAHFGLKSAAAPSIPTARIVPKGSGVRGPAPAMTNAQAVASPGMMERARAGVSNAAGAAGKFMRPAGKWLGLGALGLGAAGLYGLHHQNQYDQQQRNLVYAPLDTGGGAYY